MRKKLIVLVILNLFLIKPVCAQIQLSELKDSTRVDPVVLQIKDNVERTLFDYTTTDDLGLIQVFAPKDWTEPIVSLGFETRGIVIDGKLGLEFKSETQYFLKNEGFVIPKNTKVRIFNAGDTSLHIIEVLRPAYKPERAQQFKSF